MREEFFFLLFDNALIYHTNTFFVLVAIVLFTSFVFVFLAMKRLKLLFFVIYSVANKEHGKRDIRVKRTYKKYKKWMRLFQKNFKRIRRLTTKVVNAVKKEVLIDESERSDSQ